MDQHNDSLAEAILQSTYDGILVIDSNRKVLKYNSRFLELWGIPENLQKSNDDEELLNFVLLQLSDPKEFLNKVEELYKKPQSESFDTLYFKDGRIFDRYSCPMYLDGSIVARVWSFRDISESESIKKQLHNETIFRNAIIQALPDLVWLKDPSGVYLTCNKRFEDFFGASVKKIVGKTDYDFVEKDLADFFREHDKKAIENEKPTKNEELITFASDKHQELLETVKTAMYDEDKNLIGVLGIGHDVTEQRKFQDELKKSEERFALAMRGANDGLWDWNLLTNEVYYSPRWKSMLGYGESELDHTIDTWEQLVHPDEKEAILSKVQKILEGVSETYEVEMRMRHKDGHFIYILSRAFLARKEEDGTPIRLVGTHVDISEQKMIKEFDDKNASILKMIASGEKASKVYDEIALMYEQRHPGMRCSLLELQDGVLLHGGAPSMPQEYCDAVHGLKNGPNVGSCGTSTFLGVRTIVEDIQTDPKWENIKQHALPHGMRSCWSEPIKSSQGEVLGAFGMYYNHPGVPNKQESEDLESAARLAGIVMERDQSQKRIRELAYKDELTGIANRANFYEKLEDLIVHAKRTNKRFGILYIDLDDFKSVNDTLGHDVGDLLLKEIATRLFAACRETDFVARLSGDEFCIIVEELQDDYTSATVAQRCLDTISRPMELAGRIFKPACSIGIAHFPDHAQDASTIMKVTDTALYFAKEEGKNQYAFYQEELTKKAEYHFRMEHNLREAIENEELHLVYQPQVHITSNKIIGFEALARWEHESLGAISPIDFIPIIERIGLMEEFTAWVLKTACNQAVEWKKLGFFPFRMSVNISPNHFLDQNLVSLIQNVIEETGILPNELELEVTESVVQIDERNLSVFKKLKDLGVLTAIDDFGTGYSSLASLKHLTVDCIKIDKYFIQEMLLDEKAEFLVHSIIQLGHYMNYGIIAEGIEEKDQLDLLQKFGCETIQGFYISKPLQVEDVEDFVLKNQQELNSKK